MALNIDQQRAIALAKARQRQAQQAAPVQAEAAQVSQPQEPISANAQSFLRHAASDVPPEQREQAFRALLAKGMPEQAALEQSLFPTNLQEDLRAAVGFVRGLPGLIPSIASSAVLEPAAGIAGTIASLIPGGTASLVPGGVELVAPGLRPGVGARTVEKVRSFGVDPIGERAKQTIQSVGEQFAPMIESIPDVGGATLEATGSPLAATAVETLTVGIPEIFAGRFGITKTKALAKTLSETSLPSFQKASAGLNSHDLSVGAAKTGKELERATTSQNLLIPFEGDSALTKGQVSRNFEQLQFEKETAKLGDLGGPLRERAENQTETLIANFDALADMPNPIKTELRDIGQSVDKALTSRITRQKAKVDNLYNQARKAGELRDSVEMTTLPGMLDDIQRFESTAPNVKDIRREAIRLGAVVDDGGTLSASSMSLDDAELFRQLVNQTTDITDPRQARIRRIAISAIDDATENAGGDVYKKARRARAEMSREFENVGITKRLTGSKRGTDERQIAYEDVFKKIIIDSPIEEINKLRGTLLRSGPDGKQAWTDLKSKGIEHIKQNALSLSQMDSRGNAILSPDRLNRVIASMDSQGKLDSLYGRRGAQAIRDLGDLSKDIFTAPPGSVNFSNTASALQVALDSLATFSVTGLPLPVATTLKESVKFVKNAKTRTRIKQSLNYLDGKGE